MLLEAKCKKCGESFKLDIGEHSKEDAIKMLAKRDSFECPGHHVELSSPVNYWTFGKVIKGKAVSEAAFVKDLKSRYKEVITTDQLREKFNVEGFSMGICVAVRKSNKEKLYLDFVTSPKGKRYYIN